MSNELELILSPRISRVVLENHKLLDDLKALSGKYEINLDLKINDSILKSIPKIKFDTSIDNSKLDTQIKTTASELKKLSDIAKKSFAETFNISDKKVLNSLSKMAVDWVQAVKTMGNTDAFKISDDMINSTYESIRKLDSVINDFNEDYTSFLKHVSSSHIKVQPFGNSKDFEDLRRYIGISTVSSKRGISLDTWYMETKENPLYAQFLPSADNIEDQFLALAAAISVARDKLKQSKLSEDEIFALFGGRTGIADSLREVMEQIRSASLEVEAIPIKINPSMFSDMEAYEIAKNRIDEIRASVDELAQIKIETTPVVENGEEIEKIAKAVLKYTDSVGNAVSETLAWKQTIGEMDGKLIKENTFGTVKIDYSDNIAQVNALNDEITLLKENLTTKTSYLSKGIFSDSDAKQIEEISKKISAISASSGDAKTQLLAMDKELNSIIAHSKAGNVVEGSILNFKSSHEEIAKFVAELKNLNIEQIQVSEKGKDLFTDAKTGEQLRHITIMCEQAKNKWYEYSLAISSVDDKTRILEQGLVNTQSNLAQRQSTILARLRSDISNFQSDMGTKINNLKLGDLSDVDLSALNKLQSEITNLSVDTEDAEQKMRKLNIAFRELSADMRRGKLVDSNPIDINIKSSDDQIRAYIANIKKIESENIKIQNSSRIAFGSNAEQIRVINALISDSADNYEKIQFTINSTTGQIRELNKGMAETKITTNDLTESVKRLVAGFVSLQALTNYIKLALNEMKNVDSEMVSIQKVTGRSLEDMQALVKSAYSIGSDYGRSASEYLSSVAAFSRGGYGELADELGRLAIMAENVAEIDNELATSFLTTADKAWKLQGNVSELTKVLDGFNNIENRNATSIKKLAEGIENSGSIFREAGLEIADYAGIIGTATAVTGQSGTQIANHWKTILMTLRQIKGTTEDGGIIDEATFKKAGATIEALGVKMTYLDGNIQKLRPTMDILSDLAAVWKKLNEEGRNIRTAEIAEALGDKRNANALISVIDNWEMVIKLQNEYYNGVGSAAQESEIYLTSWTAKSEKLKNTWIEFVSESIQADWVKSLFPISSLTTFLQIFCSYASAFPNVRREYASSTLPLKTSICLKNPLKQDREQALRLY